jgi:hypothetical protein
MKFCLVVPEICRGQVHLPKKERRKRKRKRIIIIIRRRRNGAKTLFGRLKYYLYLIISLDGHQVMEQAHMNL